MDLIDCRPYAARISEAACKVNQSIALDPKKGFGLNRQRCLECERMPAAAAKKAKRRSNKVVCKHCHKEKPHYAKGYCKPCYDWRIHRKLMLSV